MSEVAAKQQLTPRVTRVQIDLDDAWPHLPDTDLVWAASSLHHLKDPQQTLHQIADSLAPRGALIVVEMDTLPRYLPDDIGVGRPRLEHRLHAAAAQAGANAHPDWALSIQEAGMELREQRTFSYHLTHDTELIAQHAHTFFSRLSEGLAHSLADEDLTTLEKILDPHHPLSLTNRTDLSLRGSRTVWAAHLPDTATEHLFKE